MGEKVLKIFSNHIIKSQCQLALSVSNLDIDYPRKGPDCLKDCWLYVQIEPQTDKTCNVLKTNYDLLFLDRTITKKMVYLIDFPMKIFLEAFTVCTEKCFFYFIQGNNKVNLY